MAAGSMTTRTGGVLMNNPMVRSEPGRPVRRHPRVRAAKKNRFRMLGSGQTLAPGLVLVVARTAPLGKAQVAIAQFAQYLQGSLLINRSFFQSLSTTAQSHHADSQRRQPTKQIAYHVKPFCNQPQSRESDL